MRGRKRVFSKMHDEGTEKLKGRKKILKYFKNFMDGEELQRIEGIYKPAYDPESMGGKGTVERSPNGIGRHP